MSKKNRNATMVAELLGINYAYALRLVRTVSGRTEHGTVLSFSDLAHGCRELVEEEEKARLGKNRKRRAHTERED